MDRREMLSGTAAAALAPIFGYTVIAPLASSKPAPPSLLIGNEYVPVTPVFAKAVLAFYPELADMDRPELENAKARLFAIADARTDYMTPWPPIADRAGAGGTLSLAEQHSLEAIQHVLNRHKAWRIFRPRALAEIGFAGVDQLHFQLEGPACGCRLVSISNEHERFNPAKQFWAHDPQFSCQAHMHLAHDREAHRAAVLADMRAALAVA